MLLYRSKAIHREYSILQEYLIFMTLKIKPLWIFEMSSTLTINDTALSNNRNASRTAVPICSVICQIFIGPENISKQTLQRKATQILWVTNLFARTVDCETCFPKYVINEEVNC